MHKIAYIQEIDCLWRAAHTGWEPDRGVLVYLGCSTHPDRV